jgi:stage II sporulation protein D
MKNLKKAFFFLAVSCAALGVNCAYSSDFVRVNILDNVESASLKVRGAYEIIDSSSGKVVSSGKDLKVTASAYKGGILLGADDFKAGKITVRAQAPDAIAVNGRTFRGTIQFIRDGALRLIAVNRIELEDYIKGILLHEASHYWPDEVLKAQAIVCRSYAVYQTRCNASKDFDLTNDIYSQVYGGKTSERYRTSRAVDDTRGQVLACEGEVFPAFYHATCAGHTEDAAAVWGMDFPPLKGVTCPFCKDSPHYSWHEVLSFGEIEEKLSGFRYAIKGINSIETEGRNNAGRIISVKVGSPQKTLKIPVKEFRNIIGPNSIRSANFTVKVAGNDAVFEGFGWGHGVGLCQWGAYFMAKEGHKYKDILAYYYPGSEVIPIDK